MFTREHQWDSDQINLIWTNKCQTICKVEIKDFRTEEEDLTNKEDKDKIEILTIRDSITLISDKIETNKTKTTQDKTKANNSNNNNNNNRICKKPLLT